MTIIVTACHHSPPSDNRTIYTARSFNQLQVGMFSGATSRVYLKLR